MHLTNIRPFGTMEDGRRVDLVTLKSGPLACEIVTYGGAVRSLTVPGRDGAPVDVALGFDTLEEYRRHNAHMGALIGRYANRIGGARFALDGREYKLAANDGPNHLHGGPMGFDKQVWRLEDAGEDFAALSLFSPHKQEGYPGDLSVRVTYALTGKELMISYQAKSDRDTLCNLTNHSYFNLSGHGSGPVDDQYIQLNAAFYTPTGPGSIPTGEIAPVEGTPMDLRRGTPIGAHVEDDFEQLELAGGYDHNWVLGGPAGELRLAARAWSERTGIVMETLTDLPGIQFYSGNYLDGLAGKDGAVYGRRGGFCLETQYFPDSPNVAHFPSALLREGETRHSRTLYRFTQQ